jgi:signal transduction histidine kinase
VPWEDGTAMQILARDLTREKQSRERQQELLAAAENANRTKDEFLATLSHELRTPLNAVLGWTQMLLSSATDGRAVRGLNVIRRNAEALQLLVEEILELSVIVSGQLRLDTARIDLRDTVKASIESVAPTAATKGLTIAAAMPDTAVMVVGDSRRLQQVLWNLLSNAVKFTTTGKVDVSLRAENGLAVVNVADTGQGIDAEFLPHVFDAFRQEDSSATRVASGLGLGLALVRRLVEAHGGTVTAHSEGRDLGAIFTISLPEAPAGSPPQDSSRFGELVSRD